MNKKKVALSLASVTLVGALAVGGTLAYLTADTNEATNVFTGDDNDLGGKVIEKFDFEKALEYLPGDVITKAPTMTNDSDSIDAYVGVKVYYFADGSEVDYADFSVKYATVDFNTADWTKVENNEKSDFFMYNSVLEAGKVTTPVFNEVSVLTGIETIIEKETKTKYNYKEVTADAEKVDLITEEADGLHYYVLESEEVSVSENEKVNGMLPELQIVVKGYMVQAKNNTADNAKAELLGLAYNAQ